MRWDVVVVGGGHAGVEAAAAAARMGLSVLMLTMDAGKVGEMPCNPAVGGVGKGQLVWELDALGGVQGWLADKASIMFKMLNRSRGPAVWGPRVQCDKVLYRKLAGRLVRWLGVEVVEDEAVELMVGDSAVEGVVGRSGHRYRARSVVLATGTFLRGVLHTGDYVRAGGREGEPPSSGLEKSLMSCGIRLRRYKTGTPPRLKRDSIDFSKMEEERGDGDWWPFSWRHRLPGRVWRPVAREMCWITRTPPTARSVVLDNLDRAPLFSGQIEGTGPRYCPSFEDKVVRFPDHDRHVIFLEPETVGGVSIYANGLATSLPVDVQERLVRMIPGLERARFLRYGYAVEYDVLEPFQLAGTMEFLELPGVYAAGQVVGSSGYEEAACQGFVAGVNAALALSGREAWVPRRDQGYIGVLVDDLVRKDHVEPYRMLTSRAEHRLRFGFYTAAERLMAVGARLGLVPEDVFHVERSFWEKRNALRDELERSRGDEPALAQLVRSGAVPPDGLASFADAYPELLELPREELLALFSVIRYEGYLRRLEREHQRLEELASVPMPSGLDLSSISGLSREVVEQLLRYQPRNLAEASRVPGMTPAAMLILASAVRRRR